MAYSLRLPEALDTSARAKADYLGISLNALICVALEAYLRPPVVASELQTKASNPSVVETKPKTLSRAEKKRLHEERKRLFR
jgi:uridylate kinase